MKSLFTPSLPNLSISHLSICIHPSRKPSFRLLGQFDYLNIKNSSAFRNYDRTTGIRQEYDRTTGRQDDRQRTLDKYMVNESRGSMNVCESCRMSHKFCDVICPAPPLQCPIVEWAIHPLERITALLWKRIRESLGGGPRRLRKPRKSGGAWLGV